MSYSIEWRAFVGPHYSDISGPYGWWSLDYGSTQAIGNSTRTTAALTAASTSIPLLNAGAFGGNGGAWIGEADGRPFEYISYRSKTAGTTLGLLTRKQVELGEHDGIHPANDLAYQWYPLATNDGRYQVSWTTDDNLSYDIWEMSMQGVNFQHWLLRNQHCVIVQVRNDPYSDWRIEWLGVIDSPASSDDAKREANWSVKVKPLISVWANQPLKGIRVGDLDIAKNSSATGTSALVMPFDERDTEDYYAADPDLSASSLVDDDDDSMWLTERFVGQSMVYVWPSNGDNRNNWGLKFNQLYLNPPPGTNQRNRWIELVLIDGQFHGYSIWAANGGSGSIGWFDGIDGVENLNDSSVPEHTGLIILCQDKAAFEQMNPLAQPNAIRE